MIFFSSLSVALVFCIRSSFLVFAVKYTIKLKDVYSASCSVQMASLPQSVSLSFQGYPSGYLAFIETNSFLERGGL